MLGWSRRKRADARKGIARWWLTGRIPFVIWPYWIRRRQIVRKQRREAQKHLDEIRDEFIKQMDAAGDDEGLITYAFHDRDEAASPYDRRLASIDVSEVIYKAQTLGIDAVESSMWTVDDDGEINLNHQAFNALKREVYEERWKRRQRTASIVVPILSLLVAMTALANSYCGGKRVEIHVVTVPQKP
jgi:hypothetical protein